VFQGSTKPINQFLVMSVDRSVGVVGATENPEFQAQS
jgi:hypothetical protein